MELKEDDISVTSIQPYTINTPAYNKALTRLGVMGRAPKPAYSPDVVVKNILRAATTPVRSAVVGTWGMVYLKIYQHCPKTFECLVKFIGHEKLLETLKPKTDKDLNNLWEQQVEDYRVHGDFSKEERKNSLLDMWRFHPRIRNALLTGGTVGVVGIGGVSCAMARGRFYWRSYRDSIGDCIQSSMRSPM
jgi:hypothetical protein